MLTPQIVESGAVSDYIPSCVSGGVEVGFYDGYVISDGVAVMIYKKSIEWTHVISQSGGEAIYDDNHTCSLVLGSTNTQIGSVKYAFTEPLVLPSGSTIDYIFSENSSFSGYNGQLYVNDQLVVDVDVSTSSKVGTRSYPSGITLNNVLVQAHGSGIIVMTVTVNPAGGKPFLLTFLDSAEQ